MRSVRLAEALAHWDQAVARLAQAATAWLVWPILYAAALGSAAWAWHRPELLTKLASNKVGWAERTNGGKWIAGALAALVAVYATATLIEWVRVRRWSLAAMAGRLNGWLAVTLALPFVVWLRHDQIERKEPIATALACGAAAAAVAVAVYALPRLGGEGEPRWLTAARNVLRSEVAPFCAIALAVGYGYWFSKLSIINHQALNTRTIDLGYYDNIFYQSIHGRPLGCSFLKGDSHPSAHFDPILVVLSPLYLLYPRAEMLLTLQSVWLASGAVPVYLLARRLLDSAGAALVLVAAYLLYPAMHGANLYEFHSLTLITPLVLWLLYFLETGAFKRYFAVLLLLWLVREDVPLLMCSVGLWAILSRRPGHARVGWITIVASLAYFVVVKRLVMASYDLLNVGAGSYGFAYYFSDLIPEKRGAMELLLSILSNPIYALRHAFTNEKKILFLLQLFLPLAGLPFFARGARVMLAYGLFICLAATREPVFTIHFQYACLIFPIAFGLTVMTLRRLGEEEAPWLGRFERRRLVRALLAFMLAASLLSSWKFGGAVENASFKGGFARVTRKLDDKQRERYRALGQMVAQIEPGASVAVTNSVGPHVSGRAEVFFYQQKKATHYVLVLESELEDWAKTWHQQRREAGALEELASHGGVKLFRVVPERDVPAKDAISAHKSRSPGKPAQKGKPPPEGDLEDERELPGLEE